MRKKLSPPEKFYIRLQKLIYQKPKKHLSTGNMQANGTSYPRHPPVFILGAFEKLRKAIINFVISGCPSVRPHGTTRPSCLSALCVYVCVLRTYAYTRHRAAETQQTSSVVGKASRLRYGWSRARIPMKASIFPLLHNVQTGSGAIQCVPEFFTWDKAAEA